MTHRGCHERRHDEIDRSVTHHSQSKGHERLQVRTRLSRCRHEFRQTVQLIFVECMGSQRTEPRAVRWGRIEKPTAVNAEIGRRLRQPCEISEKIRAHFHKITWTITQCAFE